jgi:hypothetical protein
MSEAAFWKSGRMKLWGPVVEAMRRTLCPLGILSSLAFRVKDWSQAAMEAARPREEGPDPEGYRTHCQREGMSVHQLTQP